MKRRKRIIWWEPGVAGRPTARPGQVPEYDEWPDTTWTGSNHRRPTCRHPNQGSRGHPRATPDPRRGPDPVPRRAGPLGPLGGGGRRHHLGPVHRLGTRPDRSGASYDRAVMAYLGVDYYTLRGADLALTDEKGPAPHPPAACLTAATAGRPCPGRGSAGAHRWWRRPAQSRSRSIPDVTIPTSGSHTMSYRPATRAPAAAATHANSRSLNHVRRRGASATGPR